MRKHNNIFGNTIRHRRELLGLGLGDLARLTKINKGYLSCIERGLAKPPTKPKLLRLGKVLGIEADDMQYLARCLPDDAAEVVRKYTKEATKVLRDLGATKKE